MILLEIINDERVEIVKDKTNIAIIAVGFMLIFKSPLKILAISTDVKIDIPTSSIDDKAND